MYHAITKTDFTSLCGTIYRSSLEYTKVANVHLCNVSMCEVCEMYVLISKLNGCIFCSVASNCIQKQKKYTFSEVMYSENLYISLKLIWRVTNDVFMLKSSRSSNVTNVI